MLSVQGLSVYYGSIKALNQVDLAVDDGEVVAVVGANGAGKTTLLRTVMGLHLPASGRVTFLGEQVTGLETAAIVRKGLTMVPEGRRVFPLLTVQDNLLLGAFSRRGQPVGEDLRSVYRMFPRLEERRSQKAGTLSGGEQQMLAIGRALMARPKMLLMDEPSMGLSPILSQLILSKIRDIASAGTTVLLVEQNARAALRLADRAYVLESGSVVLSGDAEDLRHNPTVVKAYLGGT